MIRVDLDIGNRDGQQYGRGFGGIQVRDQFRGKYDPQRHNVKLVNTPAQ